MHTLLVVDDDIELLKMLNHILTQEGYHVIPCTSAREALTVLDDTLPDLLLLDVMMPDMDGLTLCETLRQRETTKHLPMLLLTAYKDTDRIPAALNAGADDYIRKPFVPRELLARLRAHLRRRTSNDALPYIQINAQKHQVFVNNRLVDLTRVEYNLLLYLCRKPDEWHSTHDLLIHVWRYPDGLGDAALVRNHVRNLRRKLEMSPERPAIIQSRHRRGYMLAAHVRVNEAKPLTIFNRAAAL
jgi:two-component system, OmpR family, response regulator MtrA